MLALVPLNIHQHLSRVQKMTSEEWTQTLLSSLPPLQRHSRTRETTLEGNIYWITLVPMLTLWMIISTMIPIIRRSPFEALHRSRILRLQTRTPRDFIVEGVMRIPARI